MAGIHFKKPALMTRTSKRELFEHIFEKEASFVWNSLRRFGVPWSDLPDISHDVFLTVFRQLDTYDSTRPVRPWLFGITYRIATRHLARARHRYERGEPESEPPCPRPSTEVRLIENEARALLAEGLKALSPEQRAVFIMHEIDECAMPEIARVLSLPLNTAYSRLRLAREQLSRAVQRIRARQGEK